MKSENEWVRKWFTREMPLEEDNPLTASFEIYDNDVIGIHLADCFSGGVLSTMAIEIINIFHSRTEYDESGNGVYILVKGELPYFNGFQGLKIKTYYLTGKTVVYNNIAKNQEAIDWFMKKYDLFLKDIPCTYVDKMYYKQVSFDGHTLKISAPCVKIGSRHKSLLSYGGKLLSEGFSPESVEIKMYDFNMLYCVPPLQLDEFRGIVKSVMKYNQGV